MDILIELVIIAALAILTAFIIIFVVIKRRCSGSTMTSIVSTQNRRKPTPIYTSIPVRQSMACPAHRSPRPADDIEYLSYRKCPACRTVNTISAQYIYKIGENRFECRRCGEKFDL